MLRDKDGAAWAKSIADRKSFLAFFCKIRKSLPQIKLNFSPVYHIQKFRHSFCQADISSHCIAADNSFLHQSSFRLRRNPAARLPFPDVLYCIFLPDKQMPVTWQQGFPCKLNLPSKIIAASSSISMHNVESASFPASLTYMPSVTRYIS